MLGATGLFGSLLAKRLIRKDRFDVICAGRGVATLKEFCVQNGGRFIQLDRDDAAWVRSVLDETKPFAVVDCAGPFQYYGEDPYHFARLVIEAGAHYIDIADATGFVAGIGVLDAAAKAKNVAVISGASTTPATTAAAADFLTRDMAQVISIDTALVPGNRARRTYSVMKAVLGQVGQPYEIVRNGSPDMVSGWSESIVADLNVPGKPRVTNRLAAHVNTPDVHLFPERYGTQTATFRAGLEIKAFHRILGLGSLLVRSGIVKSLAPFVGFVRLVASWFENWGSDAGGMQVRVVGRMLNGNIDSKTWDLIADDGCGPEIPTLPVSILLEKLANKDVKAGARPVLGEVTLAEVECALAEIGAGTAIHTKRVKPVFEQVLGADFAKLPDAVQCLHSQIGYSVFAGAAHTKGSTGVLGRITAAIFGFPADGEAVPVKIMITADQEKEIWRREFDGKPFVSRLSQDNAGFLQEQFGPMVFRIGLHFKDGRLHYPVLRGRLFGWLPIPSVLLPESVAHEETDERGRFVFDVLLKFRFGGRVAHYRGWLEPLQ